MLILSLIFICANTLSQSVFLAVSQVNHLGNCPKKVKRQGNVAFLFNFKFIKPWSLFRGGRRPLVEYDEAQITKTINLPRNVWPSTPDVNEAGIERQERIQRYWEEENVYPKICENKLADLIKRRKRLPNAAKHIKIIYDGPPYANGMPHFGHFLNKTIKDVFLRFFLLRGSIPIMIPGWDCHGMPIEHKILKMYNSDDNLDEWNRPVREYLDKGVERKDSDESEVVRYIDENDIFTYEGVKELGSHLDRKGREEEAEEGDELKTDRNRRRWSLFVRDKCKEFAYRSIKEQMTYFKNAGIWAFWKDYYATYHSPYERVVIDTFIKLKDKGLIYKAKLPQVFSSKSKSVLADSEILQKRENVFTTYVSFPVDLESCVKGPLKDLKDKMAELGLKDLKLVTWTTTAYTLPGVKGIAVNRKGEYHLYRKGDSLYIMNDFPIRASNNEFWSKFKNIKSLDDLEREGSGASGVLGDSKMEVKRDVAQVVGNGLEAVDLSYPAEQPKKHFLTGYDLDGVEYQDPIFGHKYRVYLDSFVEVSKGTGLVQLNPAHGFEDYKCIQRDPRFKVADNNEGFNFCNLFDKDENFYPHIHRDLKGLNIRDLDELVLYGLLGDNLLKYEYRNLEVDIDWRCENRVHTRLTTQYCLSLPPREDILEVVDSIKVAPQSGERYLRNIIKARNRDWCLSRQRFWGTPIPYEGDLCIVGECTPDYGLSDRLWRTSKEMLDIVDVWFESALVRRFTIKVAEMVVRRMLTNKDLSDSYDFLKGIDGAPKYAIEGQDQHRGWFQSMLIVHMLNEGKSPPFEHLFSHLFVKMKHEKLSKSKMSPPETTGTEDEHKREVVAVNKDIDVMNRSYETPDKINARINEEISRKRHLLSPGYGVCRLLNPNHPRLNLNKAPSPASEKLTEGVKEGDERAGGTSGKANVCDTYFNVDVLRTLVCNNDFLTHDLELSKESLKVAKQTQKKIVSSFKYIVSILVPEGSNSRAKGNVPSGSSADSGVAAEQSAGAGSQGGFRLEIPEVRGSDHAKFRLNGLDRYFLALAYSMAEQCAEAYGKGHFFRVLGMAESFITSFSGVYLSYIKNVLYLLPRRHYQSEAARFVLNKVLYIMLKVLGPIMPHLCEDLYRTINPGALSLFSERWSRRAPSLEAPMDVMGAVLSIRRAVNKVHGNCRSCILTLEESDLTPALPKAQDLGVDLRFLFNVADVKVAKRLRNPVDSGGVRFTVEESGFPKCKRCWIFRDDVGANGLCEPCNALVSRHYRKLVR